MDFGLRRQDFHNASGFSDKNVSNKELEESFVGKFCFCKALNVSNLSQPDK